MNWAGGWHACLFLRGSDGRPPCLGSRAEGDHLLFNEYFHGETGGGCDGLHQTGWTGLIALLLHLRNPFNPCLLDFASVRPASKSPLAMEQAATLGWAPAPLRGLLTKFGFTPDRVVTIAKEQIAKHGG